MDKENNSPVDENLKELQRIELTNLQQGYLHRLDIKAPHRFLELLAVTGEKTS